MKGKPVDGWIQTYSGLMFMLAAPRPQDVSIEDISVALSRLPRFNGHSRRFYSVAQHSVWVADHLPDGFKLAGLLHDAAEAYLGDKTRPLKVLCPALKQIEHRVWCAIAARFDLPAELPDEVKHIDNVALATEKRDLMYVEPWPWQELPPPYADKITPLPPDAAQDLFLERFFSLVPPLTPGAEQP